MMCGPVVLGRAPTIKFTSSRNSLYGSATSFPPRALWLDRTIRMTCEN